jgi:hypothetical protein
MNARTVGPKSYTMDIVCSKVMLKTNSKVINSKDKKIRRERATLSYTTFRMKSWSWLSIDDNSHCGGGDASMDQVDEPVFETLSFHSRDYKMPFNSIKSLGYGRGTHGPRPQRTGLEADPRRGGPASRRARRRGGTDGEVRPWHEAKGPGGEARAVVRRVPGRPAHARAG